MPSTAGAGAARGEGAGGADGRQRRAVDKRAARCRLEALPPSAREAAREGGALPTHADGCAQPAAAQAPRRKPTRQSRRSIARDEVVPMSPLRKRIAERLVAGAARPRPSLTTFNEVDMTASWSCARSTRTLREGARRQARLHVVLREGVRRGAQAVPGRQRRDRRRRHRLQEALRLRHRGLDAARASSCRCCATSTRCRFGGIEKGIARARGQGARDGKLALDDLTGGTFRSPTAASTAR